MWFFRWLGLDTFPLSLVTRQTVHKCDHNTAREKVQILHCAPQSYLLRANANINSVRLVWSSPNKRWALVPKGLEESAGFWWSLCSSEHAGVNQSLVPLSALLADFSWIF